MKKTTKGFLLGLTTAAACVGAYYVYQNRDKIFKTEEIVNDDGTVTKKRSYLDLDNIKEKTSEAVNKTKETAQSTWKKATDSFKKKKEDGEEVAEKLGDDVVEIVDDAKDAVEDFVDDAKDEFEKAADAE